MAKHQDLCFERGSRSEESDQPTPDKPAELVHRAEDSADSLPQANRIRFAIGTGSSTASIAAFVGGAAILSIVMLAIFFQWKGTDAAKPQAVADSTVHANRTAAVAPLQGANKSNPPPSDIMAAQNRLIELGFLKGPADGVWGAKSRTALRAFKVANGFTADDKWDALVSGRLYSTQAARSPLPLATTSPAQ